MTTFAVHCRAGGCRYASLHLHSLETAEEKAQEHAVAERHRVVVSRTAERVIAIYGEACACPAKAVTA